MNYDGFIDDVSVGDILLVDGGLQSLMITAKSGKDVHCEVVDGGIMKSRCDTCALLHTRCQIWCFLSACGHMRKSYTTCAHCYLLKQFPLWLFLKFYEENFQSSQPAVFVLTLKWLTALIFDLQVLRSCLMGAVRRHLNIRGKSANLPAITERDWLDIKFGVDVGVDYYALSFVRNADVIYELKSWLAQQGRNHP